MGINLWGCCRGRQARQHRDAFTEQRSASSPLHLHSLQRPAPEFEVPASIFADFRGKGSFGLDQEMSLLSHVELNAEAKREDCAGEARTCSKPLLLVERSSLRSHSCLELLQPSGSSLSAVSFRHSLDGGSRRLPGFQGRLQQTRCEEPHLLHELCPSLHLLQQEDPAEFSLVYRMDQRLGKQTG